MKKAAYAIGLVLEVVSLVGAWILNYFAKARLGMSRWLVYHNQKWEEALPLQVLEVVAIVALVALLVASVAVWARNAKRTKLACASIVASGALAGLFAWFVAVQSVSTMKAYYLMALCLFLAALLQVVQSLALSRSGSRG